MFEAFESLYEWYHNPVVQLLLLHISHLGDSVILVSAVVVLSIQLLAAFHCLDMQNTLPKTTVSMCTPIAYVKVPSTLHHLNI